MEVEKNELTEAEAEAFREKIFSDDYDETEEIVSDVEETKDVEPQPEGLDTQSDTQVVEAEEATDQAGLDPALQSVLDGINEKLGTMGDLSYRLKQAEQRIGSVQNAVHNKPPEVKDAPTKEELIAAAKNDEEWKELKEDYPDLLESLEGRFASKDSLEGIDNIRETLTSDIDSKVTASQGVVSQLVEKRLVDLLRPGWKDDVFEVVNGNSTPKQDYLKWYNSSPLDMQNNARSNDADKAILAYDSYKKSLGVSAPQVTPEDIQEKRNKRLRDSQTTQGSGAVTKTKTVEDMTDSEYRVWLSQQPD